MVSTEFWYAEGGKSTHQSKRWWLPIPQVPEAGLSDSARKKLLNQGLLVHQVFKAARSINESVLFDMPVPTIIRDALPKVIKFFTTQASLMLTTFQNFYNYSFLLSKNQSQ